MAKTKRVRPMIAWADVGSHGDVFVFAAGPVAERYPGLLHIYWKPLPGLVPVRIVPVKRGGRSR